MGEIRKDTYGLGGALPLGPSPPPPPPPWVLVLVGDGRRATGDGVVGGVVTRPHRRAAGAVSTAAAAAGVGVGVGGRWGTGEGWGGWWGGGGGCGAMIRVVGCGFGFHYG